ncbi:zinc finger, CCHC-type containing protein [Tanacetum coccineum]
MSSEAVSSKKNMSGEAASSKKNMSAEAASSKKTMSAQAASSSSVLFLDEPQVGVIETIIVMLCRIWDVSAVTGRYLSTDLVVSDARGNIIHCTARANIAHNFIKLKEEGIYSIKNFVVEPNKEEYSIRKDDTFILKFDGATTVRKSLVKADGFVRHPFQLMDFDSVQPTNNKYLIDVARYITNVGRSIQQRTGSRTLNFYLANQSSSTLIFDDAAIPALKELEGGEQVRIDNIRTKKAGTTHRVVVRSARKQPPKSWGDGGAISTTNQWSSISMFRLELGVSDETTHVVVVMFGETASELVKCSADSIAQGEEEIHSAETAKESAGSSTVDAITNPQTSLGKRLCKHPSVSTPWKPSEEKKSRRKGYQSQKEQKRAKKPIRNEETSTREIFEANIESRIKTVVEKSQESKEKDKGKVK